MAGKESDAVEWTGVRYADGPTVEVQRWIRASPDRVWDLVSTVELMPEFCPELQSAEWAEGDRPGLGARIVGHNAHDALGEWTTTSYVVEFEPPRVFAWAVEDPDHPSATWRFTLEPDGEGTILRQWVRLGPGRSGLSIAIDRSPDKEQKIVFVRMREFEANMTATLEAITRRAEA